MLLFPSLTIFDCYLMDITVIVYTILFRVTVGNDPAPEQVNNVAIDD
jgi:hypothetical protein